MATRRVVVTGLGAISPLGLDFPTTWQNLLAGRSGAGPITRFDASAHKVRIAAEVKGFDHPIARFGRREARKMDRFIQFAVVAAEEAVQHAYLPLDKVDRERVGVVMGTGIGGVETLFHETRTLLEKGPRVNPFLVPRMLADSGPGVIAIRLGLMGPNLAVVTACASSTNAVGEALHLIRRGDADVVLAGGAEAAITPIALAGMEVIGALSTRNEEPEKASRPFDARRDGFVMGEGAAFLVLESLEHAQRRDARILAEVVGYGSTCDAHHITAPAEDGAGAARCMRHALQSAKLQPQEIDYINAHGTSTPLNDKSETAAIKTVFGEAAYAIPVSSTKSMTGHLMGAAGALEAAICVQVLQDGMLPPTINYEFPDPACDLDYVPNQARRAEVRYAMSNSFGFGGHNATIILRRWDAG